MVAGIRRACLELAIRTRRLRGEGQEAIFVARDGIREEVRMKVVVLGAGALGSVLAGHLARAGEDVMLVARGERAQYSKKHGLTITGLVDFTVPCPVVTDVKSISHADVLIATVKT